MVKESVLLEDGVGVEAAVEVGVRRYGFWGKMMGFEVVGEGCEWIRFGFHRCSLANRRRLSRRVESELQ